MGTVYVREEFLNLISASQRRTVGAEKDVKQLSTAQLQQVDNKMDTIIHQYVYDEDHYRLRALLERLQRENLLDGLINSRNHRGQTALYCAVVRGAAITALNGALNRRIEVLKTLIDFRADPNIRTNEQNVRFFNLTSVLLQTCMKL